MQSNQFLQSEVKVFLSLVKRALPTMGGVGENKLATAVNKADQPNAQETEQPKRSMSPVKDPPSPPTLANFAGSMGQLMQVRKPASEPSAKCSAHALLLW